MDDGLLISPEGELMVNANGEALETSNGVCAECGCGGTTTWPTTGWIVCTPCPGEPTPSKTVVASAAAFRAAFDSLFGVGVEPPYKCLTGSVADPAAGRNICVSADSSGTVVQIVGAPSGSLYLIASNFPSAQPGSPFFSCCECVAGNIGACATGQKGNNTTDSFAPGLSVTITTPKHRTSWLSSGEVFECCCPRVGNGVTRHSEGTYTFYERFTHPAVVGILTLVKSEYWEEWAWSVDSTVEDQLHTISGRSRRLNTYSDGSVEVFDWQQRGQSRRAGCLNFILMNMFGAPQDKTSGVMLGGFSGYVGTAATSGTVVSSCSSYTFSITQDKDTGGGSAGHREYNGSETQTYTGGAATCGGGCMDDGGGAGRALPTLAQIDEAWQ